ncbi:hypothetical protein SDRG_14341 [Saprolegnia diclina VS20]|uniref:Uncharacterized protein n=1 Tax=Saprolegnia diclina (strain VS20) TaxID=1156394 RepID=T0Q3E2_SAPDV|nr:hypothetical protein SDRG_14341 [Saprolegnia diclina VS20]EQC27920.1 hypothetical protein SDRG_14341 [Saprolegnia diclina VS20]|eukprot:XP_008618685.1 hypothetical protein SDRG_14341 [Saprolegnia diclina VS20]
MSTTRWESIADLHETIFSFAGPLTQFLNGAFSDEDALDDATSGIWVDAFQSDWPGDLAVLPMASNWAYHFGFVRSRGMYARAKAIALTGYCGDVGYYNRYFTERTDMDDVPEDIVVPDYMAAPMANVWLDELSSLLLHPIALATAAAVGGHTRLLQHLLDTGSVDATQMHFLHDGGRVLDHLAYLGHLETLRVLHGAGCHACSTDAIDHAAENGHDDVVRWLQQHRTEGCTSAALDAALLSDNVSLAAFLRASYPELTVSASVLDTAAGQGRLDLVTYLDAVCKASCSTDAMDKAATKGHLAVVVYLDTHRDEGCTVQAMDGAAYFGHLEVVQYLHAHRREGCSTLAFDTAAHENHLDVLHFLATHRVEGGTTKALDRAAHRGHVEVVRYLHARGREGCTTRAIDWAAAAGHLEIVELLCSQRPEGFTFRAMYWAAREGHFDVLAYLLPRGPSQAAQAVDRALLDRNKTVFLNLQAAAYPGTTTSAIVDVEWDPNVDGCFSFAYHDDDDDGDDDDKYCDWDSDDSTDACMFYS